MPPIYYSTVQKYVDSPLRVSILDSIRDSQFLCESRTSYQESRRESSLAGQKTKDSPMTDFLIIFQRDTCAAEHNAAWFNIRARDCMLETRSIQVIKRMFLQGHLYHGSFHAPKPLQ